MSTYTQGAQWAEALAAPPAIFGKITPDMTTSERLARLGLHHLTARGSLGKRAVMDGAELLGVWSAEEASAFCAGAEGVLRKRMEATP